jgi:hypothetical protein
MSEDDQQPTRIIKLDGSEGTGDNALVTLYTKDEMSGEKKETFQFPYALIDQDMLQKFVSYKLILGYRVLRQPKEAGGSQ